jgi:hypothetical protein
LLGHGWWFSPCTLASSTTKTGRHDIAEILLKVVLNTINQSINRSIRDEPTKSLGIKTMYMPRYIVQLVNMFNCLAYMIGRSKMNESLHDMTSTQNEMLDVCVKLSQRKKDTRNIYFDLDCIDKFIVKNK